MLEPSSAHSCSSILMLPGDTMNSNVLSHLCWSLSFCPQPAPKPVFPLENNALGSQVPALPCGPSAVMRLVTNASGILDTCLCCFWLSRMTAACCLIAGLSVVAFTLFALKGKRKAFLTQPISLSGGWWSKLAILLDTLSSVWPDSSEVDLRIQS